MLGGIGVQEILIILVVGLLVFGAARLPKIARSLGLGIKEFKKTIKGIEDDEEETGKISTPPASSGQSGQQYNQWQAPPTGPNPYQQAQYQNPNYQQPQYQNPGYQQPPTGPNPYAAGANPYQQPPQNQGYYQQGPSQNTNQEQPPEQENSKDSKEDSQ